MADRDMIAQNLAAGEILKRPSDAFVDAAKEKARTKRERKRLNRQSVKQQVREGFLAGIKAERIDMKLAIADGVGCEAPGCGKMFDDSESAWEGLDIHHSTLRSRGSGYSGGRDFGVDAPELIQLVCRACHAKWHSGPMFSGAAS